MAGKGLKQGIKTQPTVSSHIKALEETLGARLFDRTGKEVLPTKAGEVLYPYAKRILHLIV
ncbi:MAG: LysR family transcriptional regulator [Dissulfurimicrobium sp.]|uniref:LysR family transcriptional regulator n=1 Tax=Dissulfurimicrobium sp. TaxID=2022436 RepID=UPI004049B6F7